MLEIGKNLVRQFDKLEVRGHKPEIMPFLYFDRFCFRENSVMSCAIISLTSRRNIYNN